MMIRTSTPRRFIFRGTKRVRRTTLAVRTPAREHGTWIRRVTEIPSSRTSALSMTSAKHCAASASLCTRPDRFELDYGVALTPGGSIVDFSSVSSSPARSLRIRRAAFAARQFGL